MHNMFAGIMGLFMGMTSIFHGGAIHHNLTNQTQTQDQSAISGTPASPSGMRRLGKGRGRMMMNLPKGERPFFGTVTNVNGSTITLQMQTRMRSRTLMNTPSVTPEATRTLTVTLTSSTTYTGGSQADITTNTKIAGIGKVNTDGSITALQLQINPTMPSGFPRRPNNY